MSIFYLHFYIFLSPIKKTSPSINFFLKLGGGGVLGFSLLCLKKLSPPSKNIIFQNLGGEGRGGVEFSLQCVKILSPPKNWEGIWRERIRQSSCLDTGRAKDLFHFFIIAFSYFHSLCIHVSSGCSGAFLLISRGPIWAPFPIENSHLFSQYHV